MNFLFLSGPGLLVERRTLQMEPDGWIGGLLQVNEIRNGSFSFLMVILILSMLILLILVFVASCKIYYCDVIVIVAFNDVLMLILVLFFFPDILCSSEDIYFASQGFHAILFWAILDWDPQCWRQKGGEDKENFN